MHNDESKWYNLHSDGSFGKSHFWDLLVNVRAIIQMDDKETGITEMYAKDKFISKMDTKENAT